MRTSAYLSVVSVAAAVLIATACSAPVSTAPTETPSPTDVWLSLFQKTPYPYTTPLPPHTPTVLDATYVKWDPKTATPVPCRRCPDYAPEGGLWKMSLDRGVFRYFHTVTGWKSIASFAVAGDRFILFNDPYCPTEIGLYTWTLEAGYLTFVEIDDPCAIRLRAKNLTSLPWASCQPPSVEAAVTDHWPKPDGC